MTRATSDMMIANAKLRNPSSHDRTAEFIDRFGWKLCGVHGDDDHFPFIYTVGNYQCGLPELLAINCVNGHLVNSLCEIMRKRKGPFRDGELIKTRYHEYPLKALNTNDDARKYAWQVDAYYGTDDYAVQQIVIPDSVGRFPGDPRCDVPHCLVPILRGKCKLRLDGLLDFARIEK